MEYSPTFFIQYRTRISDVSVPTGTLSNTVSFEGSNFPLRTREAKVNYDFSSWAVSWGVKSTAAQIAAKKILEGQTLEADQFEFELYEVAANGTETLIETVKNRADGSIVFSPITYTSAGLRSYVVREKAGTDPQITYSSVELNYKVNVTYENFQYLAQVGAPADTSFKNIYTAPTTTTTSTTTAEPTTTVTTTTAEPTTTVTTTTAEPTTTVTTTTVEPTTTVTTTTVEPTTTVTTTTAEPTTTVTTTTAEPTTTVATTTVEPTTTVTTATTAEPATTTIAATTTGDPTTTEAAITTTVNIPGTTRSTLPPSTKKGQTLPKTGEENSLTTSLIGFALLSLVGVTGVLYRRLKSA